MSESSLPTSGGAVRRTTDILRATSWRARLAAAALVLALVAVSAYVWASPRADAGAEDLSAEELAAEVARLQSQLADTEELAERRRIEAKAASEREAGLRRGQEKASRERSAAEEARLEKQRQREREAAAALAAAQSRAGRAEAGQAETAGTLAGSRASAEEAWARAGAQEGAAGRAQESASKAWKQAGASQSEASRAWESAEQGWQQADQHEGEAARLAAQVAETKAREAALRARLDSRPTGEEPPEPVVAPTKAQILRAAASGARWWGLYTEQAPWSWATYDAAETKLEAGTTVAGYFQGWDGDFRPEGVERAWRHGQLPMMTWESRPFAAGNDVVNEPDYTSAVILSGRYDDYLRRYARDVVALGLPLAIRLNHEMNGTWYPWSDGVNTNEQGDYVRVWRHVHDIFAAEGANDLVIWVWAPNRIDNLYRERATVEFMRSQYPGDAYVDWAGMSGYWRPPFGSGDEPTFGFTFDPTLDHLRQVADKPIFLAEIGASEVGNAKPRWVDHLFRGLARPENSDIVGFAWFNLAVTTISGGDRLTNDWRVDSRGDTLREFRDGLARTRWDPLPQP